MLGRMADTFQRDKDPRRVHEIVYARLLAAVGWFTGRRGERAKGYRQVKQALEILYRLRAEEEIALTSLLRGRLATKPEELAEAKNYGEASLNRMDKSDLSRIGSVLSVLSDLANALGEHEQAEQRAQESLEIQRDLNNLRGEAGALKELGDAATRLASMKRLARFA
jgi:tetratricopeptide (TPR) repeat protein